MATEGKGKSKSNGGGLKLRGRFTPGSEVRLTKASGPEQGRPGPGDEVVDTQTVDEDGNLEFSGTEPGERYFASGQVNGQPVEVRLTGRADAEDSFLSGYESVAPERSRLGIGGAGGWSDEPLKREDGDEMSVEGQTWLAQDQVPEGTPQRSDTLRGTAAIVSQDEVTRAEKQWRKQEPTNPLLELQADPAEDPARTAEEPDRSPAKGGKD